MSIPPFFGQPGQPVPSGDPEDLKIVHDFFQETASRNPGASPPAVCVDIFKKLCKHGADMPTITYRELRSYKNRRGWRRRFLAPVAMPNSPVPINPNVAGAFGAISFYRGADGNYYADQFVEAPEPPLTSMVCPVS
jgi:hypothetical protein